CCGCWDARRVEFNPDGLELPQMRQQPMASQIGRSLASFSMPWRHGSLLDRRVRFPASPPQHG
ncbi:MAG: hypothetical protein ABGX49_01975, partial [Candidatus Poseidoniia archaeon]